MSHESWTYGQYLAIYEACNGETMHYVPTQGVRAWSHKKLSQKEFGERLAELLEIESHDDDWYLQFPDYIDRSESDMWTDMELRSELFLIEWDKAKKMYEAVHGGEEMENG